MQDRLIGNGAEITRLARKLMSYPFVSRYDRKDEPEGGSLAHCLSDLEDSFRKILDKLLPVLVHAELTQERASEILHKIGEELRHIQYHINDSEYYSYLRQAER